MKIKNESNITVAIGIATAGRRDVLTESVNFFLQLNDYPDEILISRSEDGDVDIGSLDVATSIKLIIINSPKGSCVQRNAIIHKSKSDIIVFMDDDFLPAPDFIKEIKSLFVSDDSIVVATGAVISDGILTQGISFKEGCEIIKQDKFVERENCSNVSSCYNAYGCNMAVRMDVVRKNKVEFDEALPLYAWLEDVDFSRQLAPFGRIVKYKKIRGVHLGTKRSGRSPGKQLGYSQVANPIYLAKKGTVSWKVSLSKVAHNLVANIIKSAFPEPWVDRRGRLVGNIWGVLDLLRGRLYPGKILK